MANQIPERRRHPRVSRKWFVHFMPVASAGENWSIGRVKNLSMTGVAFSSVERLEAKTQLKIKFNLPVHVLQLVLGKVIWGRQIGPQQFEYGVEFEGLGPQEAKSLQEFLAQLLKK